MKRFLAIARREIHERRLVLVTAAVVSVIPLAVPMLRGITGSAAVDARSAVALLLCAAFAIGLCVGSGVSMLAPAIASRRIAFDFARPVTAFAIWGGRFAAALVLALLSAAIVWIPALLAGARSPWPDLFVDTELPRLWPLFVGGALLAILAASHAASVAFRSRSALLALDAVLALTSGFVLSAALSRLPAFLAPEPRMYAASGFALLTGLGLVAAGFASVARGRTDIRAAHGALSLVLWAAVLTAVAGVTAYAAWVRAATPEDLTAGFWVTPAASGHAIRIQGETRGTSASFLYDTATGRSERLLVLNWAGPVFSADGRRAAWVEARPGGGPLEVLTLALDSPGASVRRTRLFLGGAPSLLVLSADGSRLAAIENKVLSIGDLESGRTLVSARIAEDRDDVRGFFVGRDVFRAYRQRTGNSSTALDVLELDAATRQLRKTGELVSRSNLLLVANPPGDRVVAIRYGDKHARLLDGRSAAVIAPLVETSAGWPGFLSDGRIVLAESSPQGPWLRVFQPDGAPGPSIALARGRWQALGGEAAPGKVVVAVGEGSHCALYLAEIDSGIVRKLADDLYPAAHLGGFSSGMNVAPAVGSEATKLFVRDGAELVRLDPLTGERRVILGKSAQP